MNLKLCQLELNAGCYVSPPGARCYPFEDRVQDDSQHTACTQARTQHTQPPAAPRDTRDPASWFIL